MAVTTSRPILIVDDDPGIRGVLRAILEEEGYQIIAAADGNEALEQITGRRPALVLTDLRHPGLCGEALHRQVQRLGLDIPIVFVSAASDIRVAARCGVAGYLRKPFALDEVIDLVACLLRERPVLV